MTSGSPRLTRREAMILAGGAAIGGALPGCSPDPASETRERADRGEIHFASLTEVADLIRVGELSPVELTNLILQRIGRIDGALKSYATVMADHALGAARLAEQSIVDGDYRGPLHGVPIAVKDLCFTKGVRTMGGLAVRRSFQPEYDATAVARLEAAGAVLLGKLNLTEGAMIGYHRDFDIPVNPWRADLWPGASSSGSGVATAAGLCFGSIGTDTGGSIRYPAMANGIVGLKPTYGRVSRYGVLALAESLDHVGPMTRRTADAAIMLEAMAGYDSNDPTSLGDPVPDIVGNLDAGIEGMRIGFDGHESGSGIAPGLFRSIEKVVATLADLGAEIVDVTMPDYPPEFFLETWLPIGGREAVQAHAETFPSRADEYGEFFRGFLEAGSRVNDDQYAEAVGRRSEFNREYESALSSVDAVVLPCAGMTMPIEADVQYGGGPGIRAAMTGLQRQFIIPADFAGTPSLTVPCGISEDGVPHAVQFVGARLSEPTLCRTGHAYEMATEWHREHPPV